MDQTNAQLLRNAFEYMGDKLTYTEYHRLTKFERDEIIKMYLDVLNGKERI